MAEFSVSENLNRMAINNGDGTNAMRVAGSLSIGGIRSLIQIPAKDLSTGILNYVTSLGNDFKLQSLTVRFSQPVVEEVSLYVDSAGANYDTLIYEELTSNDGGVTGGQDFAFYPDSEMVIYANSGQQLNLKISNNGGVGIAYAQIGIEVLP